MPQFHTVIPIHNVELAPDTSYEFSGGLLLTRLPTWVSGQTMLDRLGEADRAWIEQATHAFVFRYTADALGSPDPNWKGPGQKSIQETKYEIGVMANFALWLAHPSPICFRMVLHAPQFGSDPDIQHTERCSELLCHPNDVAARITETHLPIAATLHKALVDVRRDTAIWTAVRSAWFALQMNDETVRYLLFWVALEALFGPEDGREVTYRLSQRIAFFLGGDRREAHQLFKTAKTHYGFRSKVVHGRWKRQDPDDALKRTADVESLFRRALVRILGDRKLLKVFASKERENFLNDLIFKGNIEPAL